MQALNEMGLALTVRGKEGLSPLHHAARHNRRETVRWLTQMRKESLCVVTSVVNINNVLMCSVPREALDLVDDHRLVLPCICCVFVCCVFCCVCCCVLLFACCVCLFVCCLLCLFLFAVCCLLDVRCLVVCLLFVCICVCLFVYCVCSLCVLLFVVCLLVCLQEFIA